MCDEPTGNLDSETGRSILEILKELSASKLVIMVTHDSEFARTYGDRIIELADGVVISDDINEGINHNLKIYEGNGKLDKVIEIEDGISNEVIDYLIKWL